MNDPDTALSNLAGDLSIQDHTILVVEDNVVNLKVTVQFLEEFGFRVMTARDGEKALKRAASGKPDLILLDVMMPNMDGFETCRRLKAHSATADIPVVYMTALTDERSKVEAFIRGAVDYITKPIQREEMLARVLTHLRISSLTHRLTDENRMMRLEMELARRIQTSLLPALDDSVHPDLEVSAVMLPAEKVGGDYYDVIPGKDGALWLAIGDVSGHGVTPGLIMMMAQTIHTTLVTQHGEHPEAVVRQVNAVLCHNMRNRLKADHYMTFTTLRYGGEGRFEYAGAHEELLIFRDGGAQCERIRTEGAFLGFGPDIADSVVSGRFKLESGDLLVLYTDGMIEARNAAGDMLEVPRFVEIIGRYAGRPIAEIREGILRDVSAWSSREPKDDMSLVLVRRRVT